MKLFELYSIDEGQYDPKQFFKEEEPTKLALLRGKKIVAFLKKNCSRWLKETDNGKACVYRGFAKEPDELAFIKKVRKNRTPKDSSKATHKTYDFLIKLGKKKANRTNAVFTTGSEYDASEYGHTYVVMPIGKFNYTWHKDHQDWHGDVRWDEILVKKITANDKISNWEKEYEKMVDQSERIKQLNYQYIQKFFSQFGINFAPKQYTLLINNLSTMMSAGSQNARSTMDPGTSKNPFPNVDPKQPARYSEYHTMDYSLTVKSAALKQLYSKVLVNANKKQKAAIWKTLNTIVNRYINERQIKLKLKQHPTLKDYMHYKKYSHGKQQSVFRIGKDKISQLDKEIFQDWADDLHGDDGTLVTAINSRNEIMITSGSILAIKVDLYHEVVIPLLQGKKPKLTPNKARNLLNPFYDHGDW